MKQRRLFFGATTLWLVFVNGILAALISSLGVLSSELPNTALSIIYLLLQQLGHFQFMTFLIAIPLLLLALLLPFRKLIGPLLVLTFSAFIIMIFIDYAVFRLYRFHLNGMVWNMLTGGAMQEIFVFDTANIITLSIVILLVVLIQSLLFIYIQRWQVKQRWVSGFKTFFFVLLIMFSGQAVYALSDAFYRLDVLTQTRFIPLAQPITIKKFLRRKGWIPATHQTDEINIPSNGRFIYPRKPLECANEIERPNILVIISDSLRFDMLNPDVMPVWSELSQQGQLFNHHISTGNATRFGVYGLFSGLFGNYWFDALNNNTSSVLIDQLLQQQYRFGFFSNARLTSPEFDKTLFSRVKEFIPPATQGRNVLSREYEITRQTVSFIQENNNQPFFGFVFFDAPHAYVSPPEAQKFQPALESINYLSLNNDSDALPFLNRYKNAVHFTDQLTGDILDALKQKGLMDNTIIILTGDHGQEANETRTNSWGHNSNFSRYQTQVPLLIHWPGKSPQTYTQMTSHVDLVPTLLKEVFLCKNDNSDYSNGQSLFDTRERDFVLIKTWTDMAIANKQFIQIYPKLGPSEIRDFDSYQKLTETPEGVNNIGAKVVKSMSQFYQ